MVFVVNAAGVGKDFGLEPFQHFRCRRQANTEVGDIGKVQALPLEGMVCPFVIL